LSYYHSDNLGSTNIVTNASGTITDESDFLPYGRERVYATSSTPNHYKFTSKERDPESNGLDYFGASYYGSNSGRFMTPDWAAGPATVPYAELSNPQSMNLYAYVGNNPMSYTDAGGHVRGSRFSSGIDDAIRDWNSRDLDAEDAANEAIDRQNAQNNQNKSDQTTAQDPQTDPAPETASSGSSSSGGPSASSSDSSNASAQQPTTGEGSQANLDRRAAIANAAEDAATRAALGQTTYGPNECSTFVEDQVTKAGAQALFTPDNGPSRAPVAGEWHSPNANIPGWRILGAKEKPLPGDIAAVSIENPHRGATGHSGIVVQGKNGLTAVAAGDHGVGHDPKFIKGNRPAYYEKVVYRRYTGD